MMKENEEEKKGEIISMVEAKLPPGFRFHPRDDELICDYLMNRVLHTLPHQHLFFLHLDLNKCEPWDLPQTACVGGKEWYFYSQRDRKYATGLRTNRATATGYWKATGKDRSIHRKGTLVGMRKTLVFYKGRAPKGRKSDWVMHEFRLNDSPKEDWVLCRVFYKKREEAIKDNIRSCSLPPLMDSYINFDHSDQQEPSAYVTDDLIINEQVPCFSNSSLPMNPNPLFMDQAPAMVTDLDSFCSDQRVLRALLNQLTKMDGDGEGSSQRLFADVGIQNGAWN